MILKLEIEFKFNTPSGTNSMVQLALTNVIGSISWWMCIDISQETSNFVFN